MPDLSTISSSFPVHTELKYVSCSKLQTWLQCRRKYYWKYIRGLEPKRLHTPFLVGKAVHLGLSLFYEKELTEKEIFHKVQNHVEDILSSSFITPEDAPNIEKQKAIIIGMLKGYFKQYSNENIRPIANELHIEHPITLNVTFHGIVDLLYKDITDNTLWIMDHKTRSTITKQAVEMVPMDMQTQMYRWLVRKALKKIVHGVNFNLIRKPSIKIKKNETTAEFLERIVKDYDQRAPEFFYREKVLYSRETAEATLNDVQEIIKQMVTIYALHSFSAPDLINSYPRTTAACWTYNSRCPYWELCRYGEKPHRLLAFQPRKEYLPEEIPIDTIVKRLQSIEPHSIKEKAEKCKQQVNGV